MSLPGRHNKIVIIENQIIAGINLYKGNFMTIVVGQMYKRILDYIDWLIKINFNLLLFNTLSRIFKKGISIK